MTKPNIESGHENRPASLNDKDFLCSIAISLKRIADAIDGSNNDFNGVAYSLHGIEQNTRKYP